MGDRRAPDYDLDRYFFSDWRGQLSPSVGSITQIYLIFWKNGSRVVLGNALA